MAQGPRAAIDRYEAMLLDPAATPTGKSVEFKRKYKRSANGSDPEDQTEVLIGELGVSTGQKNPIPFVILSPGDEQVGTLTSNGPAAGTFWSQLRLALKLGYAAPGGDRSTRGDRQLIAAEAWDDRDEIVRVWTDDANRANPTSGIVSCIYEGASMKWLSDRIVMELRFRSEIETAW